MGLALVAIFLLISPATGLAQSPPGAIISKQKALVLGGGGEVGEAWESGIIAGLAEKSVDLSHADLIIGTSAGAIVGARLAIGTPPDLMKVILNPPEGTVPPPQPAGPPPDLSILMRKFQEMESGQRPLQQIRAEIGAWALKAPPITTEDDFVTSYIRRFPEKQWPSRAYECTAVDAADGYFKVWDKDSGIPLARAVASSCALPGLFAPIMIDGHRYMDGGMRSANNADLARGYKTVVVIAFALGRTHNEIAKRYGALAALLLSPATLESELKALRDGGSKVVLIAPDAASLKAFGGNVGDASRRVPAANAGLIEGRNRAVEIHSEWKN